MRVRRRLSERREQRWRKTHCQSRSGGFGKNDGVNVALIVIVLLVSFAPFVLVGALFVWGAVKDGQEDRAVQRRLGIRRRTRLGR
jgi:hypothetical protein